MTRPASIPTALELLNRLRAAAPAATATRLEQVILLIENLSAETAFFNARLVEDSSLLEAEPHPAEPAATPIVPPAIDLPDQQITGDSTAFDVLTGLNDALRAPLVAIRGRAEMLHAGTAGQITEEQGQWLDAIHENTERAFRVLEAVQRLIAMQRDETLVDWSNFITSDLMEEARERTQSRAAARGHEIAIQRPDSIPMAHGDFYQSLIVLTDLIDNAVRYTQEGGQIRMSVDTLGTHVLFSVADNGIGLRPEDMAQIGQPFWRGSHHPLVRQHPGTGLSLFLARRILASQGGELIFSGEPGVGSTFSFTLSIPG